MAVEVAVSASFARESDVSALSCERTCLHFSRSLPDVFVTEDDGKAPASSRQRALISFARLESGLALVSSLNRPAMQHHQRTPASVWAVPTAASAPIGLSLKSTALPRPQYFLR